MSYSRSEISELALGQLKSEDLDQAVEAFKGFERLFGRSWLDKKFQGTQSAVLVLYVVSLWEKWTLVKALEGSEGILKRWKAGIDEAGVSAEVRVLAHLVSMQAKVHLFPQVGNRFSDFRFQVDSQWIYGEVSRRGISKVRKRSTEILQRVATAAAAAIGDKHGKVAVLRDLEDNDLERLVSWLASFSNCEETQLDDLAVFHAGSMDSTIDQDKSLIQLVAKPRLFVTSFSRPDDDTLQKGSACMCVSDQSAQEILETEAAQLSLDHPGVVILDISSVIGGCSEWYPLIQRRLQPDINTRISGVLLLEIALGHDGPITRGSFLINPHARNPLPASAIALFESAISSECGRLGWSVE